MWKQKTIAASLISLAMLAPLSATAQQPSPDQWAFSLTPYLWLPTINGSLKYGPPGAGAPSVELDADSYLSNLNFALMLQGEARKGRWSVFTDVITLDFSADHSSVKGVDFGGSFVNTTVEGASDTSVKAAVWTLAGGYTAVQSPKGLLDFFGGFRYLGLKTSTDWKLSATVTGPQGGTQVFPRSGSVSESTDVWDGIVGVRGNMKLGTGPWSLPYYVDVGAGSSKLTWQAVAGVAYAFKWGDVVLAYRHLSYEQDSGKLVQDLNFGGLALGATFRF